MDLAYRRPRLQRTRSRMREKIDVEKENANLRVHFEKRMGEKTRAHTKVAVLMLSWKKEMEDDLDTADEVARLTDVFETQYHFKVCHGEMTQERKAKNQINHHLAKFVDEEDDQRTLLIIYYAGHGVENPEDEEFVLAGGNPASPEKRRSKFAKEIVWRKAETLIEDTDADMLLIFDCCHAGRVAGARGRAFSPRIFEVLAACQDDERTVAPGPESFTTALIWALSELASIPEGFTTAQLYAKIFSSGILPNDQHPYWNEKMGVHSLRRLKIQPLSNITTDETKQADLALDVSSAPIKYFVNLSMMFSEMPTDLDIEDICMGLRDIVKPVQKRSTQPHQVRWRGLFPGEKLKEEFSSVAEKAWWRWRAQTLDSQLRHRLLESLGPSPPPPPLFQRPSLIPVTSTTSTISPSSKEGIVGSIEVTQLPHGDIRLHPTKRRPFLRQVYMHGIFKRVLVGIFVLVFGIILGEYRERLWYDSHFIPLVVGILPVEWVKTINGTI